MNVSRGRAEKVTEELKLTVGPTSGSETKSDSRAFGALWLDAEILLATLGGLTVLAVALANLSAWNTAVFLSQEYRAPWLRVASPFVPNVADWTLGTGLTFLVCLTAAVAARFRRRIVWLCVSLVAMVAGLVSSQFDLQTIAVAMLGAVAGAALSYARWRISRAREETYGRSPLLSSSTKSTGISIPPSLSDGMLLASLIFCAISSTSMLCRYTVGNAPIYVQDHPEILRVVRVDAAGLTGLDVANQCIWVSTPVRLEAPRVPH